MKTDGTGSKTDGAPFAETSNLHITLLTACSHDGTRKGQHPRVKAAQRHAKKGMEEGLISAGYNKLGGILSVVMGIPFWKGNLRCDCRFSPMEIPLPPIAAAIITHVHVSFAFRA